MTKVVVLGHGGYGSAMRRNIEMLSGVQEDFFYVDFNEEDDAEILRGKIHVSVVYARALSGSLFCIYIPQSFSWILHRTSCYPS